MMKLGQMLFVMNENGLEADVCTDYTDELDIAYVGDDSVSLTDEGKREFGELMDLDVDWSEGDRNAIVQINHFDDEKCERLNDLLIRFFNAAAGNVGNAKYEAWFKCDD